MKNILDVHSHVQFPAYDVDREAVIERARKAGVKMLAVGTQFSTSESAIKLAHQYPDDIWATVGYHPNHLGEEWFHDKKEQSESAPEKFDAVRFRELAKDPKVVAIGECGLDYYRLVEGEKLKVKSLQKEVFLEQVEIAKDLKKALMIHCRPSIASAKGGSASGGKASAGKPSKGTDDAYYDLLEILNPKTYTLNPIVHFYVGSLEITKKLVDAGFYFTFGGVITFARDYDESIKYIPLDRILLETDCPYVAPKSNRGKRNEPAYILETLEKMAEIKGIDAEKAQEQILKNSLTIFGLTL